MDDKTYKMVQEKYDAEYEVWKKSEPNLKDIFEDYEKLIKYVEKYKKGQVTKR